jgi:chromosome segregation ATPase
MPTETSPMKTMEQRLANLEAGMTGLTTSVAALSKAVESIDNKMDRFDDLFIEQARADERAQHQEQKIERAFDAIRKQDGRFQQHCEATEMRFRQTEGRVDDTEKEIAAARGMLKGVLWAAGVVWTVTVAGLAIWVKVSGAG